MLSRNKGFMETTIMYLCVLGASILLTAIIAYYKGSEHTKNEYEARNAEERIKRMAMISDLALELADRSAKKAEDDQKVKNELKRIEETWKKPGVIIKYLPPDPVREHNCPVLTGWVQYHDKRAAGMPDDAGPAAGVAGTPSGIKETTALETVGDNYAICFQYKERVREILGDFDEKRSAVNSVVNRINKRLDKAERKVQ